MLELKNLSKTFYQGLSEKKVLEKISLKVKPGSVFGYLGLNGTGKTTTVKIIGGLLFTDEGKVTIGKFNHDSIEAKALLGFMPEGPQFHSHLKAREVLEYVGDLFGLDQPTIEKRATELLKEVGLAEAAETPVKKFSKGMTQRLGMAVALMNDPALLVLDEPLDGLDPVGRLDFKKLISQLKKRGKTVFFSTHILSDVEEICDEVAIISGGKIIAQGAPKKLIGNSRRSLEEVFVEMVKK